MGETLNLLMEGPDPDGEEIGESKRIGSGIGQWVFDLLSDYEWKPPLGVNSEFVGGNETTTELEGLPPPPAGVSASAAKNKGMDNYKQGQFADAIKWLSWAVVLLEKADDDDGTMEVLSSRASFYKEVGEYKKAMADCTKLISIVNYCLWSRSGLWDMM
ncbi:hypothetical protein PHJA_002518600 [Phtheirospermum japonicum]|uniref:Uncharacterized protein n=1 Tax=Phtheirospermum japonicum TaxID=374723 RepID=A0A830CT47_9LAMI|nr:hypothetical protein PHJA_002518600 [Phtheirospermum japonicum]